MNSQQLFEEMCAAMMDEDAWRERISDEIDALPETVDIEAELQDLIDARDDVEFTRWGGA